jgi:hypothetical protein
MSNAPTAADLQDLRDARITMKRIRDIPPEQWQELSDEVLKEYNDELTKCGVIITEFKNVFEFLP